MAVTLRGCNWEFRLAFRAVRIMVTQYGKPFSMERGGGFSIASPYLGEALTHGGVFVAAMGGSVDLSDGSSCGPMVRRIGGPAPIEP